MNEYFAYFTATFWIDKLFVPMSCQLKSEIYFLVNLQRWTKRLKNTILYLYSQPTTKTLTIPEGKVPKQTWVQTVTLVFPKIIISNYHTPHSVFLVFRYVRFVT